MGHCAELSFCVKISEERPLGGNAAMRTAKLWGFEVWVLFHGSDVLPTKNNVENMKLKKNKIFEHSENWNVLIQFVCEHCFHSRLKNWKLELIPCCWCWVFFPGCGRSKSGFRQIDFDALTWNSAYFSLSTSRYQILGKWRMVPT